MTNPGHVDPGYVGNLTFTVINMGKEPYELRRGDRIVTLLLFKLEHPAEAGWSSRRNNGRGLGVTEERMEQLSADLNVEQRAREVAKGEEQKTRIFAFAAPIIIGLLALLASVYQSRVANEQKIQDLSKQVAVLTERLKVQNLDQRVSDLEKNRQQNPTSTTKSP
jgi:hypothetical protein